MQVPPARGPLSGWITARLTQTTDQPAPQVTVPGPIVADDDFQLALWCCNELNYRGFDHAPTDADWAPDILAFRTALERPWTQWLQATFRPEPAAGPIATQLRHLIQADHGPPLASYLHRHADLGQFRQFVTYRSIYQLKEADPHSFAIPRLDGPTKAALVEIQADEYGGGRPERMHAELFRTTMRWLGLDDSYGHYLPQAPAITLAVSNLMSLFALHHRWTPALLGHLAALEMTSTLPNRRYAAGALRLGASPEQAAYFTEHIEADAVHEQIAAHDLCANYTAQHPHATTDIIFGAATCLGLDNLHAHHLLTTWHQPATSDNRALSP
ncbi:iron-containing redox enzyme family protein [Kribbella pittospori]|uniref:Iron-containing redox enzyme family protein n=1 Tax=Kribbella pittospori TaxID=722689 RepID=A0A4V2M6N1_9ACTN|nr:iron-containing redox enzyme family protein [Kribbella pittospori]TCC44382.1 iron-containing redox enzyme family protein [Kribbella pittospori]